MDIRFYRFLWYGCGKMCIRDRVCPIPSLITEIGTLWLRAVVAHVLRAVYEDRYRCSPISSPSLFLSLIHISELINEKKIEGISNVNDESDRNGMRIVIERMICDRKSKPFPVRE